MNLPKGLLTLALAGAALACLPLAAHAETDHDEARIAIDLRGVDLSTRDGAKIVLSRIKAATFEMCGGRPALRQLRAMQAHDACRRDFLARAVAAIDAPMVTAMAPQPPRG